MALEELEHHIPYVIWLPASISCVHCFELIGLLVDSAGGNLWCLWAVNIFIS